MDLSTPLTLGNMLAGFIWFTFILFMLALLAGFLRARSDRKSEEEFWKRSIKKEVDKLK